MRRGFVEIYLQIVLGLRVFDIPVNIHDSRRLLKDFLDLRSELGLALVVWPIYFRDEGFENRRPGRDLGHLEARTKGRGQFIQFGPQATRDLMALGLAIVTRQ